MASSCEIRQTVLRLIGCDNTWLARRVRSASDCRLNGSSVSATASQAAATTQARSIGKKIGLSAASFQIDHGQIAQGPPMSPASNLSFRLSHLSTNFVVADIGMFVNRKRQAISMHFLNESRASPNRTAGLLQKILGEGITCPLWSRHDPPPCDSSNFSPLPYIVRNPDAICEAGH